MIATLALLSVLLQAPPPPTTLPDSPVGYWIAEHPTTATPTPTPELWWSFLPDGTVTATAGIIIRTHWTLDGNTLTIAPTPASPAAGSFTIHFQEGKLLSTATSTALPPSNSPALASRPTHKWPSSASGASPTLRTPPTHRKRLFATV